MSSGSLRVMPASWAKRITCISTATASKPTSSFRKLTVFGPTPYKC